MTEAKKTVKKAPKGATKAAGPSNAKKEKAPNTQYAVFETGGKQYRVSPGDSIKIEKIIGDLKEGDTITFDKVLLVDDGATEATIGTPFIAGAAVTAILKKIGRYKTIDVIKYKQKSRYFKKNGHRQPYFEIEIQGIK